ncbi:hypothetical protein D3C73_1102380 [compost metagenome]
MIRIFGSTFLKEGRNRSFFRKVRSCGIAVFEDLPVLLCQNRKLLHSAVQVCKRPLQQHMEMLQQLVDRIGTVDRSIEADFTLEQALLPLDDHCEIGQGSG